MKRYASIGLVPLVCMLAACSSTANKQRKEVDERQDISALVVEDPMYPVLVRNQHNVLLHLTITVNRPSVLNAVTISTSGTTSLSDINQISVYHTANDAQFYASDLYASTELTDEEVTLSGNKSMSVGEHHLWVSFRLVPETNSDHSVTARLESLTINNIETIVAHKGKRKRIGVALRKRGEDGVDAYRIPGLVTTKEGTLLAVYDVRYNSSVDLQEDIDVGLSRSTDGGRHWERMKIIIDQGEWGGKPQNANGVGDPSILVDRVTGTIWVAALWTHGYPDQRAWFASGPGMTPEETGQFILVKSNDDGRTWSEPINITSQIKDPKWHLLLAGPGKGISMTNGTLVFPAQFKDHNEVPFSTIISSADHGDTWQIGTGVRAETTEAQVVELSDGRLMLNCRNNEARDQLGVGRFVATTKDLGKSWQEHSSSITALEESTCMASLVRECFAGTDDLLLFSNPNTHTGRSRMTLKVSTDDGSTWPATHWLLLDEGSSWGYSCLTRIDEEYIGILYEGSQANLTFQRIPIEELMR